MNKNPLEHLSDEELAQKLVNNDTKAFDELYRRYKRVIYVILRRMMFDHETARDLFQDIMMSMYTSITSFKGGSFHKWMVTIAINKAKNHSRDTSGDWQNRSPMPLDYENLLPVEPSIKDNGIFSLIHEALRRLPEPMRTIVILHEFQEFSHGEISEILGIPPQNTRVSLFRGLRMIRDILRPVVKDSDV